MALNQIKVNNIRIVGVDDFPTKNSQNLLKSKGLTFLNKTVESGFYVTDEQYNIAIKYDASGFDVFKISDDFKKKIYINVFENGLYIIDKNYNAIAKFDNNGFHCVNILEFSEN